MDYSKRIRGLREDTDKTQTEIAIFLETSQTMYARYERFANELPLRHLIKLCMYYNVSADYILGFTNQKIPLPYSGRRPKIKCDFPPATFDQPKESIKKSSNSNKKSVLPKK